MKPYSGVTLIELIIVIVVITILVTAVSPSLSDMVQRFRLDRDQSRLAEVLKEAKRIAKTEITMVSVILENHQGDNSSVTLSPNNADPDVSKLSDSSIFETIETVRFSATGAVTPPDGMSYIRLVLKNESISQKRYVDITASGQIISQQAGFQP